MATTRHLLVDPFNKCDYQPVLSGLDDRPGNPTRNQAWSRWSNRPSSRRPGAYRASTCSDLAPFWPNFVGQTNGFGGDSTILNVKTLQQANTYAGVPVLREATPEPPEGGVGEPDPELPRAAETEEADAEPAGTSTEHQPSPADRREHRPRLRARTLRWRNTSNSSSAMAGAENARSGGAREGVRRRLEPATAQAAS